MAAKLSNEKYVHYHSNMSEHITKVTQTKTNYDQFRHNMHQGWYNPESEQVTKMTETKTNYNQF